MSYLGIDIGGTKCAVLRGQGTEIEEKVRFETTAFPETLDKILTGVRRLMTPAVTAVGISCGGPLDCRRGIIQSPPSLPDWVDVPIVSIIEKALGKPTHLCNDADACALAEWRYGAGKGTENMVFLTCGTGFGAGLILNGQLYSGFCGSAGEIGHVTLHPDGDHIGYYKRGAAEGYCSGSGIAQYGAGSAKEIADRAKAGDPQAIALFQTIGADLGRAVAILVDLLNPEAVVLGSIYARCTDLLQPSLEEQLKKEALLPAVEACRILPAALGEQIGDVAALTVAAIG